MENESITDFTQTILPPKSALTSSGVIPRSKPIEEVCITFNNLEKWVMKIHHGKIIFNREDFPDLTPDDFAKKVVDILELHLINYARSIKF